MIFFFFQTPLRSWLLPTKKPRLQISWSTRRFALRSVSQRSVSPSRWAASPKSRLLHLSTPTPAAVRRHLSPQVSRRVSDVRGLQRLVAACSDPVWIATFSFISLDFNAEWKTFDDFYLQKPPKTQNWHPRSPRPLFASPELFFFLFQGSRWRPSSFSSSPSSSSQLCTRGETSVPNLVFSEHFDCLISMNQENLFKSPRKSSWSRSRIWKCLICPLSLV